MKDRCSLAAFTTLEVVVVGVGLVLAHGGEAGGAGGRGRQDLHLLEQGDGGGDGDHPQGQ